MIGVSTPMYFCSGAVSLREFFPWGAIALFAPIYGTSYQLIDILIIYIYSMCTHNTFVHS